MNKCVIYVHGKGGSASEADHYKPLFPRRDVVGLDYRTFTPWETGEEIWAFVSDLRRKYDGAILIANSIGAYFSMCAGIDADIEKAFFISPVVDMEKLILGMMAGEGVSEDELKEKRIIPTGSGDDLSWEYLVYVRDHPVKWRVPTDIVFGDRDVITPYETVASFARESGARLHVLKGGEHWFHTEEQMNFIDSIIHE